MRIEHIRAGRHTSGQSHRGDAARRQQSQINHAIYWTMPWLKPLKPLLRPFVRSFLRQDRDIMVRQQQGLQHQPVAAPHRRRRHPGEVVHRLKQEYLRARAEQRPFVNPVKDRLLRWRS